ALIYPPRVFLARSTSGRPPSRLRLESSAMPIRLLLCVLRSRWFGTPALIVLLASGCELAEPVAPPTGDLSALEHPAGLGHFTIEVDPRAGFVDLRAPALDMERAGSSSASVPAGGPGYALIPATED